MKPFMGAFRAVVIGKRQRSQNFRLLLAAGVIASAQALFAAEVANPAGNTDFFEKNIRPVLVDKCYKCHSADSAKVKGGLLLDKREASRRGGDTGPAVVPGDLNRSLLIGAIRYTNADLAMPPEKSGGKLPEAVIKNFEQWVKAGAPDPREGDAASAALAKKYDTSTATSWWSFQPLHKTTAPKTKDSKWPRTDVDRYILAGLQVKGLTPVGDADKATLLRRVYFDLIGLPPTPAEALAFQSDNDPQAFAKVVDKLLASPQFGETWGRHWLDVARYAESSGKDANVTYPNAWRYRDYVTASFNEDKPYNRFIQEQIAGDLLPTHNERERATNLIATGFLAIGAKSLSEMNPKQFAADQADEQLDSTCQAVMGLTVGCARCHDHKFDPISQKNYTALAGIFLSTDTYYGTAGAVQGRNQSPLLTLPKGSGQPIVTKTLTPAEYARKEQQLEELTKEVRQLLLERAPGNQNRMRASSNAMTQFEVVRLFTQRSQLSAELAGYETNGQPKAMAMGVREKPTYLPVGYRRAFLENGQRPNGFERIGDAPLFVRGDVNKPSDTVRRDLPPVPAGVPASPIARGSSGRMELAQWLTSAENPLTSRVMANRVWHWLFGRGLVGSVDNFGTSGEQPTNPELLDYLAEQFIADGWSVKKLIREIVLSRTYQLASTYDETRFAADPDNLLQWRHNPRRLDAEAIRDAILYAAESLDLKPPAGSVIGRAGEGPIGGPRFMALSEEQIARAEADTRSLYLPSARNLPPEVLAVFDLPDASAVQGAREVTTVPTQALFMMNSDLVSRQAHKLSARLIKAYPGGANDKFDERFDLACWIVFNRLPDAQERAAAKELTKHYPDDADSAWHSISRALFASAEFRSLN